MKFYEIFSEKIQLAKGEEAEDNQLPLIGITGENVFIRLPKCQIDNEFEKWLEEKLKDPNNPIQYKLEKLTVEKEYKMGKGANEKIIKKEIPENIDGISYHKKFTLSLEEASKFLKNVPDQGLANLTKFTGQPELKLQHCHKPEIWGNAPNIPNTISLTLAQLDPQLQKELKELDSHPQPHQDHLVPIVEFDDFGMLIKTPTSKENFSSLIKQFFGLKQLVNAEGAKLEETHFERKYEVFRVEREGVENFLKQLGMDNIPAQNLHERYMNGDISYLQHLVETRCYHPYRPERTNDALTSIKDSLSDLVPNELKVQANVSYHPRGWLSIKLPNWGENYNEMLANYLKTELIPINHEFNGEHYTSEIIIHEEDIPKFLKTLELEKTPDGSSYVERLKNYAGKESLDEVFSEANQGEIDLPRTISRRLGTLDPNNKGKGLKDFSRRGFPEAAGIILPRVNINNGIIEIRIHPKQNENKVKIGPEKELTFGEYLSHVFALDGFYQEFNNNMEYCINVPLERMKGFLVKDLSLRLLPQEYKKDDLFTFFNLFKKNYNPPYKPPGTVANLRLRNPSIPLPENIPDISKEQILDTVNKTLDKHLKKETLIDVFKDTFKRIFPGRDNPDMKEYNEHKATAAEILKFLKAITHELITNKEIPQDRKRETIINIAEECKGACLPGRLTKIEKIYRKLKNPEFEDEVKYLVLEEVDNFKEGVLSEHFINLPHGVHVVNLAKLNWGIEFGLNQEAGRLDEPLRRNKDNFKKDLEDFFLTPEKKAEVEDDFKKNLLSSVSKLIRNTKQMDKVPGKEEEEMGSVLNVGDYQTRLREILRDEGLKPDQIAVEIARLIPTQQTMQEILDNEGQQALLKYMLSDTAAAKMEMEDAFRKNLLSQIDKLINNKESIRNIDDFMAKLSNFLRIEGFIDEQIEEMMGVLPSKNIMEEILQKKGKDTFLKEMQNLTKANQCNAEINELFLTKKPDAYNITQGAVKMLLINVGALNS